MPDDYCDHLAELGHPEDTLEVLYALFDGEDRGNPTATLESASAVLGQNAGNLRPIVLHALGSAVAYRISRQVEIGVRELSAFLKPEFRCEKCLSRWYRDEYTALWKKDATCSAANYVSQYVAAGDRELALRELDFEAKFQLLKRLGEGGLGVAYLATQLQPPVREVVIKFPKQFADPRVRERFNMEANTLAQIDSSHVVRIWEMGVRGWCSPQPFIQMEYCAGGRIVPGEFSNDFAGAADCIEQLAEGLSVIHAHSLVHGDIKPDNCLRKSNGQNTFALADFGFARHVDYSSGVTPYQSTRGTSGYAAPEHERGQPGQFSDTFSLGCTFYALIEGHPPQRDARNGSIEWHPSWPWALRQICDQALQLETSSRYRDAGSICDELRNWRRGYPTMAEKRHLWRPVLLFLKRNYLAAIVTLLLFVAVGFLLQQFQQSRAQQQTMAARMVDRGTEYCRQGDSAAGLLTLGKSLLELSTQQHDLADSARRVIASELRSVHTLTAVLDSFRGLVLATSFSDDGKWLAVGDDKGDVRIFSVPSFTEVAQTSVGGVFDNLAINTLDWCADNRRLLIGTGKRLAVFDAQAKTMGPSWPHDGQIRAAMYRDSQGQQVLVGGYTSGQDSEICVYDVTAADATRRAAQPFGRARALAISEDGQWLATGGEDRHVRVFDIESGSAVTSSTMLHPGPLFAIALRPDKQAIATGCLDGKIRLFELPSGRRLGESLVHRGPIRSLAFSADGGRLLSGSEDGTGQLWDVSEPVQFRALGPPLHHLADVRCVAMHPTGAYLVTAGMDTSLRVWRTAPTNGLVAEMRHAAAISVATFAPGQERILTASLDAESQLGEARIWSLQGELEQRLAHGGEVLAAAIRPGDPSLAVTAGARSVKLWSLSGSEVPTVLQEWPIARMATASFSPNGKKLAFAGRTQTLYVCDDLATPHAPLRETKIQAGGLISRVSFSPDSALLLCDGGYIETSSTPDAADKQKLAMARLARSDYQADGPVAALIHEQEVRGAIFSQRGDRILTLSFDGSAKIWDAVLQKVPSPVFVLGGDRGRLSAGVFSADDRMVATGGASRLLRIWDMSDGHLRRTIPHTSWIRAIAFHPAGNLLALGGDDGLVQLWEPRAGISMGTAQRHNGPVTQLEFSQDGSMLLSGGADGVVKLWSVPVPVRGNATQVQDLIRTSLGLELSPDNSLRVIDGKAWRALK